MAVSDLSLSPMFHVQSGDSDMPAYIFLGCFERHWISAFRYTNHIRFSLLELSLRGVPPRSIEQVEDDYISNAPFARNFARMPLINAIHSASTTMASYNRRGVATEHLLGREMWDQLRADPQASRSLYICPEAVTCGRWRRVGAFGQNNFWIGPPLPPREIVTVYKGANVTDGLVVKNHWDGVVAPSLKKPKFGKLPADISRPFVKLEDYIMRWRTA